MKTNQIFQATEYTFDDVIFSNRNQAYGAYNLRKTYNKHLMLALLLVAVLFVSGTCIPLLFPSEPIIIDPPKVIAKVDPIAIDPKDFIPPAPKDNNLENITRNPNTSGQVVVVDTVLIPENGNGDLPLLTEVPVDTSQGITGDLTFKNHSDNDIIPDPEEIQTIVQTPATYLGNDINSFREWVQKNVVYPAEAIRAEVEGRVTMSFVVGLDGKITDVKVVRGVHPSVNEETARVIVSSSSDWQPARQNGRPVKQRIYLPVTYVLNR